MSENSIQFTLTDKTNMELSIQSGVFKPTATTRFLIDSILNHVVQPGSVLDLGSGSGVVGISLFIQKIVESPLYSSDYSKPAIESITENCKKYNVPVEARHGSLFEPWKNHKFDYIVDDISGIAKDVAMISPWFDKIPCDSGDDGTVLTNKVLEQAPNYLTSKGILFFPVISFSDTEKIVSCARNNFSHVELIRREEWPLPKEMEKHLPEIKKARDRGYIQLKEVFGMIVCTTEIYLAHNHK
jgi:ribosomal protein L11 methylase PrmA